MRQGKATCGYLLAVLVGAQEWPDLQEEGMNNGREAAFSASQPHEALTWAPASLAALTPPLQAQPLPPRMYQGLGCNPNQALCSQGRVGLSPPLILLAGEVYVAFLHSIPSTPPTGHFLLGTVRVPHPRLLCHPMPTPLQWSKLLLYPDKDKHQMA